MTDTARTLAAIKTLLADNNTGDISPQDVRDTIESIVNPVAGGGFSTEPINAKVYLEGDGSTESGAAIDAFVAAVAANGKVGYFPAGSYVFPDGKTITTASFTTYYGDGPLSTSISTKDAYVFSCDGHTAGQGNAVWLRGIGMSIRSGSTSGGAVHFAGGEQGCTYFIDECWGSGVSTSTDPVAFIDGFVGGWLRGGQWNGGGGDGIKLTSGTAWFGNVFEVAPERIQSTSQADTTHAAIHAVGCTAVVIAPRVIETFKGRGVWLEGTNWAEIEHIWFEDVYNTAVLLASTEGVSVHNNKFQGPRSSGSGGEATADHLTLTGTQYGRHHNHIVNNHFQDGANSGVSIRVGANVEFTTIINNRNASLVDGTIIDGGMSSTILGNDTGSNPGADDIKLPGVIQGPLSSDTFVSGNSAANLNYIVVNSDGMLCYRTTDKTSILGSSDLAPNGFAFFWDEAAGKIKVRVRNNAGAYSTLDVTP